MGRLSGQDRIETKIDTLTTNLATTDGKADGIETHVHSIETKVDAIDTIIDDLHNTDIPDIHTDVADLHTDVADIHTDVADIHTDLVKTIFNNSAEFDTKYNEPKTVFGLGSDSLIEDANLTPITVTGGNNATGTSVLLNDGSSFGFHAYLWPTHLIVTAVTSANISSLLSITNGTYGAEVVADSITSADDYVNKSSMPAISDGDRVVFHSLSDETKGITSKIVYYVVNKTTDKFKVALTSGGSAIDITADLTGHYKRVEPNETFGSILVRETATACGSKYYEYPCWGINYTDATWVDAKSASGSTVTISFYIAGVLSGTPP